MSLTPSSLLVISGPTATGKSALAVALARTLDGEIINVDSAQVYRGMDIGSAKTQDSERGGVPHHLIDLRSVSESFNVAEFLSEATQVITDVQRRGKLAVVVGGTTLYLTALFHGLAKLPPVDPEVRTKLNAFDTAVLWSKLAQCDPDSATRLHINDRVRVLRALETFEVTGIPASRMQAAHAFQATPYRGLFLVLCMERSKLYQRINERAAIMIEQGLIDETANLMKLTTAESQALRSIGYAQTAAFLKGELSREYLEEQIAMATRRFAKRQMTYWRNEPLKRGWVTRPKIGEGNEEVKGRKASEKSFRALDFEYKMLLNEIRKRLAEPFSQNEVWYINAERAIQ